jgi:hypothetical protein
MNKNDFKKRGGFNKPVSVTESDNGEREAVIIAEPPSEEVKETAPIEEVPIVDKVLQETGIDIKNLQPHPFNNYPDMNPEDFLDLKKSLEYAGYDPKLPIWLYPDKKDGNKLKVLEGKNRGRAIIEINTTNPLQQVLPLFKEFEGTDLEALDFVERTNIRRKNLTKSQLAEVAFGAGKMRDVILEAVAKEKADKLKGNQNAKKERKNKGGIKSATDKKEKYKRESRKKLADKYDTNSNYIGEVGKLDDETRLKVHTGELSISDIKKEKRAKAHSAGEPPTIKVIANVAESHAKIELAEEQIADLIKIADLIEKAKAEILDLEMNNPKGLLDAELIKKVQDVKYQLGHTLTKE